MWFLFGIITLISVCCYQAYKRINAAWTGEEQVIENIKYQYKFEKEKGKVKGLFLGLKGPENLDFALKREKTLDRFFKHVGIAKEHQTGNKDFDDLIYVVSDHDALQAHISKDDNFVKTAIKVFSYKWAYESKVDEIRCNSGRLWLHLKVKDELEDTPPKHIAQKLVPWLKAISDNLTASRIKQCETFKDPFVIKAAVILAISSGLFISGFLHMFRILWQEVPYTLDVTDFRIAVAGVSTTIMLLLVLSTFYLLGRSARTHLVLIELMIMGTAGTVFTVGSQMRDLNMDLDSAEPQRYIVMTHDRRVSKGRRSNSYYLFVDDWMDENGLNKNVTRRVEVDSSFYHSVRSGDELVIVQKPGYLDYRWVERILKL